MTSFPPLEKVAEAWGLGKVRLHKLPYGHRMQCLVEAPKGEWFVLKQVREKMPMPKLQEILVTLQTMAKHQDMHFIAYPLLLKEKEKAVILEWQGKNFYLVPFIKGRRPSYRKVKDVEIVMRTLGLLHRMGEEVSRSLVQKDLGPPSENLWTEFNSNIDKYKRVLAQLETLNKRKWWSYPVQWKRKGFEEQLQLAESIMRSGRRNGDTLNEKSIQKKRFDFLKGPFSDVCLTMCHGDTHENNYLLSTNTPSAGSTSKEGVTCYLIDVESFKPDFAVIDMVAPLHYLGFYTRWKEQDQQRALQAYERERPLTQMERIFLCANLALPFHWLRAMRSFLKQQGKWKDTGTWRKFFRTMLWARKHRGFAESMRKRLL